MATITTVICDRCGKRAAGCRPVYATIRSFTDAAGSMDTEQVTVDLCGECGAAELTRLLTDNVPAGRQWWLGFQKRRHTSGK